MASRGRSVAERRHKAPVARDIAGLLRSIDYAAGAALERTLQTGPDDGGHLAARLDVWRWHAAKTLLGAYHETLGEASLWPDDAAAGAGLLKFFLIEKAFYEIEYELMHRPDWLRVPLSGAVRILEGQ